MKLEQVGNARIKNLGNVKVKEVTLSGPKGKLLTFNQIKEYCQELEKKAPKGSKMVVRGSNILKTVRCLRVGNRHYRQVAPVD